MKRGLPCCIGVLIFIRVFGFCGTMEQVLPCALSLRVFGWTCGVEPSVVESCDTDVEDVLVDDLGGPVDNPGTTMGT